MLKFSPVHEEAIAIPTKVVQFGSLVLVERERRGECFTTAAVRHCTGLGYGAISRGFDQGMEPQVLTYQYGEYSEFPCQPFKFRIGRHGEISWEGVVSLYLLTDKNCSSEVAHSNKLLCHCNLETSGPDSSKRFSAYATTRTTQRNVNV